MATSEYQQLILALQRNIGRLDFEQLKIVAHEIRKLDKEWPMDTSSMSEPEVFNKIVDFVRNDKLNDSKDEGVSHLQHLLEVVENLQKGNNDPELEEQEAKPLLPPDDSASDRDGKTTLSKFGNICHIEPQTKTGSPTVYKVVPEIEMADTLKKKLFGQKNPNMKSKAILLVGETGAGKSTLINALMNQALGVQWEDDVWFQFVENEQPSDGQQRNQADSQTSDVVVYQLFGFEGKPLSCPLTIIDTPGYGDTRGNDRDDVVKIRLSELFRSDDGVHEISAVGLVLKATENRVSDRLTYIFDSVMSLFRKDMEENIVALITHSDGIECANVLRALEDANVTLAKDEDNDSVCFMFNNRQDFPRTRKRKALKATWDTTMTEIGQFREFVDQKPPQNVKETVVVLDTRVRLTACIQNLKERIEWIEKRQDEIKDTEDVKERHDTNKMEKDKISNLLDHLKKKLQEHQKEKDQLLEEAYNHVLNLDKTALNQNSVSTKEHLDFLIVRMKEEGDDGKAKALEEIKKRMDETKRFKAAFNYFFSKN